VRKDASRMSDEQAEQGILRGGKFDFTACSRYHTRRKIDNQTTILENGNFVFWTGLSLRCAEAREQFRCAERLGHVVVCAGIESGHLFLHVITHGQDNTRRFASLTRTV